MLFRGTFKDINENDVLVLIQTDGDQSSVVNINEENSSIKFTKDAPVVISSEMENTFDTVIKSQCQINLLCKDYMGNNWFTGNARNIIVNIYRNDKCLFAGFVEPNIYSQPFSKVYDQVTLNCTDGLATLQYYNYKNLTNLTDYQVYKQNATNKSFKEILENIFSEISQINLLPGNQSSVYYDGSVRFSFESSVPTYIFINNQVNELLFLGEEFDDIYTNDEILHEILQYLDLHVRQIGLDYYIFNWASIKEGADNVFYTLYSGTLYTIEQQDYITESPGNYREKLKPINTSELTPQVFGASSSEYLIGNTLTSSLGDVEKILDGDKYIYVKYYYVDTPNGNKIKTEDYIEVDTSDQDFYLLHNEEYYILDQDDEGDYTLDEEAPDSAFDFDGDFRHDALTYQVDKSSFIIEGEAAQIIQPSSSFYTITWQIEGSVFRVDRLTPGEEIIEPNAPDREYYDFSWEYYPQVMPDNDLTINGVYTFNQSSNYFTIVWTIEGKIIEQQKLKYGSDIIKPAISQAPEKQGYTFGWVDVPETMPAQNLIIYGGYNPNPYTVNWYIDNVLYHSNTVLYTYPITPYTPDNRTGYTFAGWEDIPGTMPYNDINIYGSWSLNYHNVYWVADGVTIHTDSIGYGTTNFTKPASDREGYLIIWENIPESMPDNEVYINGRYVDAALYTPLNISYSQPFTLSYEDEMQVRQDYYYSFDMNNWNSLYYGMEVQVPANTKLYIGRIPDGIEGQPKFKLTVSSASSPENPLKIAGSVASLDDINDMVKEERGVQVELPFYLDEFYFDASELKLPYTSLTYGQYRGMFKNSLICGTAPELPAQYLANYCYAEMFYGSRYLTNASPLHIEMFTEYSCSEMYYNSAITQIPDIQSNSLGEHCFDKAFASCENLTNVEINLDSVSPDAFWYAFSYCTELQSVTINIPSLDARSFGGAFYKCGKLNEVYISSTSKQSNSTLGWLSDVAETGTVYCSTQLELELNSDNGVPEGWTRVYYYDAPLGLIHNDEMTLTGMGDVFEYSLDNSTWNTLTELNVAANTPVYISSSSMNPNYKITLSATNSHLSPVKVFGSIESMYGRETIGTTDVQPYAFVFPFSGTARFDCRKLDLHYTTVLSSGFSNAFKETNIVYAPEVLPGTTLASHSYYGMFMNCTKLLTSPKVLPAENLPQGVYQNMFYDCTSLTNIPEIKATDAAGTQCMQGMFNGCTSLTEVILWNLNSASGDNAMSDLFRNCTSLSKVYTWMMNDYTNCIGMLNNVNATGTFYAYATFLVNMKWGDSTFPSAWDTVQITEVDIEDLTA